jgi:3-methylfumaryl-CoA hydratase
MWAGSRVQFHHPLKAGEQACRHSTVHDVQLKQGASGEMVFVTVRHEVQGEGGQVALSELQDIVYRADPQPGAPPAAPQPAPGAPQWQRTLVPDEVMLFRYSALTFNAHRIHYDRPYATSVEGYPGLVVHGPLIATLLLSHLCQRLAEGGRTPAVAAFEFRAVRPAFDGAALTLCAAAADATGGHTLWAQDASGALCMRASAQLA